jgi:hypothetical protein
LKRYETLHERQKADIDVLAGRAAFGKVTTLKSLLDSAGLNEEGPAIPVPTSRLRKTVQSAAIHDFLLPVQGAPTNATTPTGGTTGETTTEASRTNTTAATTTAAVTELIPVETVPDIDDNDEEIQNVAQQIICDESDNDSFFDDLPRSRDKSDTPFISIYMHNYFRWV